MFKSKSSSIFNSWDSWKFREKRESPIRSSSRWGCRITPVLRLTSNPPRGTLPFLRKRAHSSVKGRFWNLFKVLYFDQKTSSYSSYVALITILAQIQGSTSRGNLLWCCRGADTPEACLGLLLLSQGGAEPTPWPRSHSTRGWGLGAGGRSGSERLLVGLPAVRVAATQPRWALSLINGVNKNTYLRGWWWGWESWDLLRTVPTYCRCLTVFSFWD